MFHVSTGWRRAFDGAIPCVVIGLIGGLLLLTPGCRDEGHGNRTPLRGTVTISGRAPAINGTIYFDPIGQSGVGSSAEVAPDGKFEVSPETGPTPGLRYNVTYTTAPGIPAEGTPLDSIEVSQTYRSEIDVPAGGDQEVELQIEFQDAGEN